MPYCTHCGRPVLEEARFCSNCGRALGPAPGGVGVATLSVTPLDYTIQGDNLQIVRVRLQPGQEIYAEAGKMVYKTANVAWESRMSGQGLGEKLWGALKRKLMGESLFWTYFRSQGAGEVGFAGAYPGRIRAFDLKPGESILVQRDAFLCAQSTVKLDIAFVKRIGAGLFGGEGFILEKLTGPGTVFIHAGGDSVEFQLGPAETLQVDTGCIVGFDEGVDYDVQLAGGIKTAIFGGEGLFLATLTGPGRVILQSMTLEKLRRELMPVRTGGDERGALEALGGIFRSED
ncbi:MAG: TIGR00266 family protein [Bryobacterales bacterium]|nr:TIGR00266 family protein [Bryobacteraceae bacterium]MDW8130974.1 TIGR00266 family protein [Bryobacterales bacterium]